MIRRRNRLAGCLLLAALLVACGNRLPSPAVGPANAAYPQGTGPDVAATLDGHEAADLPPADAALEAGPAAGADASLDAEATPVDVLPPDGTPPVDASPETDSTPAPDAQAETTPTDVSQPEDVSLVTDCKSKPMMAIFAEAKAKGVPGYVYLLGGFVNDVNGNPDDKSAIVQRLDLASGVWSTAGILPEVRHEGIATWVAGSIWLMGGHSCASGDKTFPCESKYPSVCGKFACHEMWRRGPDDVWQAFDNGIAGPPGYKGFLPAGCSVLSGSETLYTFDGETGTIVNEVKAVYPEGGSNVALAPWQEGFALLGGAAVGAKTSLPIVLLDAAGKPTGKTLPAPPCGVSIPRMWSTATHLFVMDYQIVPTSSNCAGTLEETWLDQIPQTRPVAWDGKSWAVAPTIPKVKGSQFVQTPIGTFHIGSGSANGKLLTGLSVYTGTVWMDPETHVWSDAKYPPMLIPKYGVAATWAPK